MFPRTPAHGRHDELYRPPTNLPVAVAVALAVPLTLFAVTHPTFLAGAVGGAVAVAIAR